MLAKHQLFRSIAVQHTKRVTMNPKKQVQQLVATVKTYLPKKKGDKAVSNKVMESEVGFESGGTYPLSESRQVSPALKE